MRAIYFIGIRIYYLMILLASAWNRKASLWIHGRRGWKDRLRNRFEDNDNVIWFHCASLGEFEQGRPVIEMVRKEQPDKKILLTFFSPSGYEKRKNYPLVDHVDYLPVDTRRNARKFLESVKVEKAMFIKYEFWPSFLFALKNSGIPVYLLSGHFRKNQLFFKWYGSSYRKLLKSFQQLFVQHEGSVKLLEGIGISNVSVTGDTRFDRVVAIAEEHKQMILPFNKEKIPVIIGGSTWEKDEEILHEAWVCFENNIRMIIAPHDPTQKNVSRLQRMFPGSTLFSKIKELDQESATMIIVDTIGHLSSLYWYGDIAFIGGGFGKGIHNILEATARGMPVFFGPEYDKFHEAKELIILGGAQSIRTADEFIHACKKYLEDKASLEKIKDLTRNYTFTHTGATRIIYREIFYK